MPLAGMIFFDSFEDLATPGGSRQSQDKPYWLTENFGTGPAFHPRQPEKLLAKPSPLTRSSGLSHGNVIDEHANAMYQTACPLTAPWITVTDGAKKDGSRSPTIPQPAQDSESTEGDRRIQKMFVRRRPARLAIQSYNPGISRVEPVQVLDDS